MEREKDRQGKRGNGSRRERRKLANTLKIAGVEGGKERKRIKAPPGEPRSHPRSKLSDIL